MKKPIRIIIDNSATINGVEEGSVFIKSDDQDFNTLLNNAHEIINNQNLNRDINERYEIVYTKSGFDIRMKSKNNEDGEVIFSAYKPV